MATFDSKSNLIAAVCQQIHGKLPHENGNLNIFVQHFFKRVPIEYLQKTLLSELVSIVQEAWKLFQIRQPCESLVKIKEYTLNHHTVPRLGIFMVNLDQPFLIDSISAFLDRNGFKTELIVHPVLGVQRNQHGKLISVVDLKEIHPLTGLDQRSPASMGQEIVSNPKRTQLKDNNININNQPESVAFIQIKSNLKKKQIGNLLKEINDLITQVRNVVSDWPLMKDQLHHLRNLITKLPVTKKFPSSLERNDLKELLSWLEHGRFVFLGSRFFPSPSRRKL